MAKPYSAASVPLRKIDGRIATEADSDAVRTLDLQISPEQPDFLMMRIEEKYVRVSIDDLIGAITELRRGTVAGVDEPDGGRAPT